MSQDGLHDVKTPFFSSLLTLFASSSTLICCALPALLVPFNAQTPSAPSIPSTAVLVQELAKKTHVANFLTHFDPKCELVLKYDETQTLSTATVLKAQQSLRPVMANGMATAKRPTGSTATTASYSSKTVSKYVFYLKQVVCVNNIMFVYIISL